jgi:dipeptidyl aminopeptidase/acylaminoacyl peptidase
VDVKPGQICYLTNRRDGVSFDPVIRDLATGAERVVVLGDWPTGEAALSPDGRWLALAAPSTTLPRSAWVVLADLATPPDAKPEVTEVTDPGQPAWNGRVQWLPGSDALILTSNLGREFTGVARYDVATREWTWLVTDDTADLMGWPSPDGSRLLVERNDDGASVLSLHDAVTGARLCEPALPGTGSVTGIQWPDPVWAADSSTVVLTITGTDLPGDVLRVDAGRGSVRQLTHSVRGLGGDRAVAPVQHLVPAPDGEQIPCQVYPAAAAADPALAGSAVVFVHGGPEAQAKRVFNPQVQALAAAGHTVVVPNVRGSTGYGKR